MIKKMGMTEQRERPKTRVTMRKEMESKQVYIESHELSLLSLLIQTHPERAKEFLHRLKLSCQSQDIVL